MELDTERIIIEVQARPFLYDVHHGDYKNRQKRRDGWIAATSSIVGEGYIEMDKQQKEDLCKDVQKKWKSIKDCYYKNLKNQDGRSGDPSKNKKPYIYHKQLTFLQSSVVQRQTSGNMADNLTEGSQDAGKNTAQEDVETESTAVQSTSSTAPFLSGITQREKHSQLPKKRKQDEFEKSVLDVLKVGLQQLQPKEPKKNDPDEMFLLSQLPLIKNFDPADKMDFQIKYLNLVQSYTRRGICMRCRNVY